MMKREAINSETIVMRKFATATEQVSTLIRNKGRHNEKSPLEYSSQVNNLLI